MGLCKERESKRIITLKVSEKGSICGENETTHGGIYTYSRIDCTALLNHRALSFTAHIQMYIYIYIYLQFVFVGDRDKTCPNRNWYSYQLPSAGRGSL